MKYLAIDIGNVICELDFSHFIVSLTSHLNISEKEANIFLNKIQKANDLGISEIKYELRNHFGMISNSSIELFICEWNNTIRIHDKMISLLKDLISTNIKIALLSNIGIEHKLLISDILYPIYDQCIKFFSCDVGARKPTFLYYKTFIEMYPDFKNSFYIDDRIENLEASKIFNFRTYHLALDIHKNEIDNKILEIKSML